MTERPDRKCAYCGKPSGRFIYCSHKCKKVMDGKRQNLKKRALRRANGDQRGKETDARGTEAA